MCIADMDTVPLRTPVPPTYRNDKASLGLGSKNWKSHPLSKYNLY